MLKHVNLKLYLKGLSLVTFLYTTEGAFAASCLNRHSLYPEVSFRVDGKNHPAAKNALDDFVRQNLSGRINHTTSKSKATVIFKAVGSGSGARKANGYAASEFDLTTLTANVRYTLIRRDNGSVLYQSQTPTFRDKAFADQIDFGGFIAKQNLSFNAPAFLEALCDKYPRVAPPKVKKTPAKFKAKPQPVKINNNNYKLSLPNPNDSPLKRSPKPSEGFWESLKDLANENANLIAFLSAIIPIFGGVIGFFSFLRKGRYNPTRSDRRENSDSSPVTQINNYYATPSNTEINSNVNEVKKRNIRN